MHQPTANICVLLHLVLSIFSSGLAGSVPTAAVPTPNVTNTSSTALDTKTSKGDSQSQSMLASRLDELQRFFHAANETNLLESIFVRLEKLQAALDAAGWKKDRTETKHSEVRPVTSGTTYVRWGRANCEGDAEVVYTGQVAGAHYNEGGGGANFLCMHHTPQWNRTLVGVQGLTGHVWGMEYELVDSGQNLNNVFSSAANGGQALGDKPAPCALCHVPTRSTHAMIPGRTECPAGWTAEYGGYLMTSHHGHGHRTSYECFDADLQTAAGATNQNQALLYPVQVRCGTLACSRYIDGLEVTCVVCSK